MDENLQYMRKEIDRLRKGQEGILEALFAVQAILKSLDRGGEYSDTSVVKSVEANHLLDKRLTAEALRLELPRVMTENLRDLLTVLIEAGDEYLSESMMVGPPGGISSPAGVLGSLNARLREGPFEQQFIYAYWSSILEKEGEGYRLPAHLRDVVREALELWQR